jgi:chaperonin GroEL
VTLVNIAAGIKAEGADSISAGRQILKNALKQPFLQITQNAGLKSEALLAQVEAGKSGLGVDVNDPDAGLIDVKKAGVIDPTRVTKEAVQNAVSIASTAATMGALVVDIPEPATPVAPAGGMGGGMGF